jgi:phosphotransferase system enzyme I (PtsP)
MRFMDKLLAKPPRNLREVLTGWAVENHVELA